MADIGMKKEGEKIDKGKDDAYPYVDLMMIYFGNGMVNDVVVRSCGRVMWFGSLEWGQ